MKPDIFLRLYPGDWLKDTLRLDATAMGAYFLLILDHRGKPGIPSDDQTLRTIARVRESDWMRVKGQIAAYFEVKGDLWVNKRSVEDWARDCEDHRIALERSRLANEARWGKPKDTESDATSNPASNAQGLLIDSQSESESESESEDRDKGRVKVKKEKGPNGVRHSAVSDEEWLLLVRTNPAYKDIDVPREYSKWQLWCSTHKRKPTQHRFLAWLNRIEAPMTGAPQRKPF